MSEKNFTGREKNFTNDLIKPLKIKHSLILSK